MIGGQAEKGHRANPSLWGVPTPGPPSDKTLVSDRLMHMRCLYQLGMSAALKRQSQSPPLKACASPDHQSRHSQLLCGWCRSASVSLDGMDSDLPLLFHHRAHWQKKLAVPLTSANKAHVTGGASLLQHVHRSMSCKFYCSPVSLWGARLQ